jgi:hypothetical protein
MPTLEALSKIVLQDVMDDPDKRFSEILKGIPEAITSNIESLLLYLSSDLPWKKKDVNEINTGLFVRLTESIAKNISKVTTRLKLDNPDTNKVCIQKLLNFIHQQKAPVITFNYDTLFEKLFCTYEREFVSSTLRDEHNFSILEKLNYELIIIRENLYTRDKHISPQEKFYLDGSFKVEKPYPSEQTVYSLNGKLYFREDGTPDKDSLIAYLKSIQAQHIPEEVYGWIAGACLPYFSFGKEKFDQIHIQTLYHMPMQNINNRGGGEGVFTVSAGDYPNFHLLKLHGSINWYYSGTNKFPAEQLYSSDKDSEPETDLSLFIVPPLLDKSNYYFHTSMNQLWFKAGEALRQADEVYFIGYSLPETDLSVRLLLNDSIKPTAKIIIIDPSSKVGDRYKNCFETVNRKISFDYVTSERNVLELFIDSF